MLFFVCAWLLLMAVCWLAGCAALECVAGVGAPSRAGDRFLLSVWLGLGALSLLMLAASLFAPLTPLCGTAVAGAVSAAALLSRSVRAEVSLLAGRLRPSLTLGLLALAAGVAAFNSQPVTNFDTGLYHFGHVRWLAEHGAVRGLALVHSRFAFTSSWFALSAPFDAGPFESRAAALANGFALMLALLHALVCARRWAAGAALDSDRLMVLTSSVAIPPIVYWRLSVSASPDLPIIFMMVVAAWAMSLVSDREALSPGAPAKVRLVPLLLASAALGVKLTALPLVAVACVFYAWRGGLSPRGLAVAVAVATISALPVLAYGFITSGCVLFPSAVLCSDVPWSVGAGTAAHLSALIRDWARWDGPTPPWANGLNWTVPWATRELSRGRVASMLFCALLAGAGALIRARTRLRGPGGLVSLVGCIGLTLLLLFYAAEFFMALATAAAAVVVSGRVRDKPGWFWLLTAGLAGGALTLYAAPAPRFGLGYTAVLIAAVLISLAKSPARSGAFMASSWRCPGALALLLLAGGMAFLSLRFVVKTFEMGDKVERPSEERLWRLLLPPALPKATVTIRETGHLKYFAPAAGTQCWAAELPCTPYEPPDDIELRDPARGLGAGFEHTLRQR
jgi:hypothetical protein